VLWEMGGWWFLAKFWGASLAFLYFFSKTGIPEEWGLVKGETR